MEIQSASILFLNNSIYFCERNHLYAFVHARKMVSFIKWNIRFSYNKKQETEAFICHLKVKQSSFRIVMVLFFNELLP